MPGYLARVVELSDGDTARIDRRRAEGNPLALVEDVAVGDYVIVHVGYVSSTRSSARWRAERIAGGCFARKKYIDEGWCAGAQVSPRQSARRGRSGARLRIHGVLRRPIPYAIRAGVTDLLLLNAHGPRPGCPVCVLPIGPPDMAISAGARAAGGTVSCWRLWFACRSRRACRCRRARARGAAIRVILSGWDAPQPCARTNPEREVVFFAIGFRDHHAAHRAW